VSIVFRFNKLAVAVWLLAAREVADFLGTDHHEFIFTVQVRLCVHYLC
jgi:hypothetical protein